MREELARYQNNSPCEVCKGKRLKPEALAVKIAGLDIAQVADLSIAQAVAWFRALDAQADAQAARDRPAHPEGDQGAAGLPEDVGLEYLTLSRAAGTLSGGESQRIRLASQIGSGLTGVLYVLDEPSIGLHQRDNDRLLETLKRLRDLGNTVLVVEHDEEAIRAADYLIDMGPGAGRPWRPGRRRGHAGQGDAESGQPDRPVSHGDAPDPRPACCAARPRAGRSSAWSARGPTI